MQRSDELTERYTEDDSDIQEGVRELHPNRNENKPEGRQKGAGLREKRL